MKRLMLLAAVLSISSPSNLTFAGKKDQESNKIAKIGQKCAGVELKFKFDKYGELIKFQDWENYTKTGRVSKCKEIFLPYHIVCEIINYFDLKDAIQTFGNVSKSFNAFLHKALSMKGVLIYCYLQADNLDFVSLMKFAKANLSYFEDKTRCIKFVFEKVDFEDLLQKNKNIKFDSSKATNIKLISEEGVLTLGSDCKYTKHLMLNCYKSLKKLNLHEKINKLDHIELQDCKELDFESFLSLAKRCNGLTYLDLDGCEQLTKETLSKFLKNPKKLSYLNLVDCNKIELKHIKQFADKLINLRELRLSCKYGDEIIRSFTNSKKLRILSLCKMEGLTCDGIEIIAKNFPLLEVLKLPLGSGITDENIKNLSEKCNLKVLELPYEFNNITDEAVYSIIKNCKNFRLLIGVLACGLMQITEKAEEDFKKAFPDCKLRYEDENF